MGKKQHEAARVCEPVAEESPDCSAIKAEKKKMKKKKDKQNEDSPKRKLEEVEVQDSTEPKTKKSKKHKKSRKKSAEEIVAVETNGTENGREDESVRDEHVVVTGKNIEDEKYAPTMAFSASGLPKEVLEYCKSFEKPSPIQSRAWPFLS